MKYMGNVLSFSDSNILSNENLPCLRVGRLFKM